MYRILKYFLLTLSLTSPVFAAEDVYFAESQAGSHDGSSCANAIALSNITWGSGSPAIGAGDTAHLCGTFTFSANTNGLNVGSSGSAGSPVTIKFETGAIFQAPYFYGTDGTSGAIKISGKSYVTIDGGTDGIIKNTANGSARTYQNVSYGVAIQTSDHVIIKNLHLLDFYVRSDVDNENLPETCAVYLWNSTVSNITIDNNVIDWTNKGIILVYPGSATCSNVEIKNNTVTHCGTAIAIANGNTNAILNGVLIHDNDFDGGSDWWDPADNYHLNHMHIFGVASGDQINGLEIYNNYLHGYFGNGYGTGHQTGSVFIETGPGSITGARIYNNLITQLTAGDYSSEGLIYLKGTTSTEIYNNTLLGVDGIGIHPSDSDSGSKIKNNIISGVNYYIYDDGGSTITESNRNIFYGGSQKFYYGTTQYSTLTAWRGLGFDTNSQETNPLLDGSYKLQAGSPAIDNGENLYSLGITGLDSDMAGVARPEVAAWDIGAYEYGLATPSNFRGVSARGIVH